MADDNDDQTTKLPPFENWASQTFAYGFMLDRSGDATTAYSGNTAPNKSGKTGFSSPQPDDIHLLNLNPQSISFDEPVATDIAFSQGGGKVIESKGWLVKTVSIRGTTGLLPPIAPYATHMQQTPTLAPTAKDDDLGVALRQRERQTGFFEFYHLRRLFRQFMKERRDGRYVRMHYLDFKADEFWVIEPKRFHLDRSRFSFSYDINFDCVEPSQKRTGTAQGTDVMLPDSTRDIGAYALRQLRNPINASLDSVASRAITRVTQLSASAKAFTQRFDTGVLSLKLQSVIKAATNVQSFFADVAAIRRSILDVPLGLYKQLYSALIGLEDAFDDVTPDAFKADVNEWMIEMRFVTEGLISHHLTTYGSTPGQALVDENKKYTQPRATQGTKNNFFEEQSANSGSPPVDPFIGSSGLGLTGDVEQMSAVVALRPEDVLTGETIFDVAQRLLGDARRFTELVVFNRLRAPFIVSDPKKRLPGTIAWSEKILVPALPDSLSASTASPVTAPVQAYSDTIATTLPDLDTVYGNNDVMSNPWRVDMWEGFTVEFTVGALIGQKRIIVSNDSTSFVVNRPFSAAPAVGAAFEIRLDLFTSRRAPQPDTAAFGRDMLAVFTKSNGLLSAGLIDVVIGPRRQTQTVEGLENLEQAIAMCLQTVKGSNKSNPQYGAASVVGRAFEPNNVALHVFYVRQALMADPRISSVERPRVTYEGTNLFLEFSVRPVRVQRSLFFRIPL